MLIYKLIIVIMNKYQQAFNHYKGVMGDNNQFSKVENFIILIHSINRANKLVCLDGIEQFQFPVNWRTPKDDSYTFTYRNDRNNSYLKLVAVQKENRLQVQFKQVNSSLSYRTVLNLDHSDDQNAKNYDLNLQQYLKQSEKTQKRPHELIRDSPYTTNIDAPYEGAYSQNINLAGYPPRSLINPPSTINNPFGQEEYVGPNSQIFYNPIDPYQNVPPYPGSLQIPPGARYDPVDPFDDPRQTKSKGPQEFFGFDEFGRPRKAQFGGINPINPKPGQRGGFGGFGGGFGPNFGF